jgi:hypothetical protein
MLNALAKSAYAFDPLDASDRRFTVFSLHDLPNTKAAGTPAEAERLLLLSPEVRSFVSLPCTSLIRSSRFTSQSAARVSYAAVPAASLSGRRSVAGVSSLWTKPARSDRPRTSSSALRIIASKSVLG